MASTNPQRPSGLEGSAMGVAGSEKPVKRRAAFFGQQVIRLMAKTCFANEHGQAAFTLITIISATQDAAQKRVVTYFNTQLMQVTGIKKWDTLDRVRKACIDAGWLKYSQAGSGHKEPGAYQVVIPDRFAHITDSLRDESPEAYPAIGDGHGDGHEKAYPAIGDGHGDGHGYGHGEYPSSTSTSTSKRVHAPFTRPTIEDVRAYCIERKNHIDPERFINHYDANGWKVGRNPMKDWKAAVRNWESRNDYQGNGSHRSTLPAQVYEEIQPFLKAGRK